MGHPRPHRRQGDLRERVGVRWWYRIGRAIGNRIRRAGQSGCELEAGPTLAETGARRSAEAHTGLTSQSKCYQFAPCR
jgi:hypothetical protein